MSFPSSVSCSSKLIKLKEGMTVFSRVVRRTGYNLELQLASEGGGLRLWNWALNLWDLMLPPVRQGQNSIELSWIECRTPAGVRIVWCRGGGDSPQHMLELDEEPFLIRISFLFETE